MNPGKRLLTVLSALAIAMGVLAVGGQELAPTAAATTSRTSAALPTRNQSSGQADTLTNFNSSGQQVVRFDVNGNAVDAHDGQIARFGSTYYLYGTSYNCGYRWGVNSNFCGFKVYSSPDLTHWTDRGYVVLPYACGDCFRPHILYDAATHKYVLWTNDSAAPDNFRVYTNDSPTGVFTQQATPRLAIPCGWDFALFHDPVSGRDYVVHTACGALDGYDMAVEQLTKNDLTGDGKSAVVPAGGVEAPAMFYRNGMYYITVSDPTCGYCTGTGTGYETAPSPLGPWTGTSPWSIKNGELLFSNGGAGVIGLSAAGSSWTDYKFAADVTPLETGALGSTKYAQASMVFRMNSAHDGYGFLLSNYPYSSPARGGYVVFVKFSGGGPVATEAAPLPFPVVAGQSYHVVIGVSGSTFTITVNGTLADTVSDTSYTSGRVGFRDFSTESAYYDNVEVTASDGSVLLEDDFSQGLSQWDVPMSPIVVSSRSCGGQPSFVTPLPGADGSTVYLYGSDLWQGKRNEGQANFFWAPLQFSSSGAIEPIQCSPSAKVSLAGSHPGHQAPIPALDQSSGVQGFSLTCDIAGANEEMQTFAAGRTGTLRQLRFTAFQSSVTGFQNPPAPWPSAPLQLRLVTVTPQGGIGQVLAQQTFNPSAVGFAARNLSMDPDVQVTKGSTYAVVASSATTQGCYGFASSDTDPYSSGHAADSTDGGATFTAQPTQDLKFLTVVM